MPQEKIRNFVIIAHVDHGKSTLADRFLELTNTVEKFKMRDQFLDMNPLERERGITIKMQPVRMLYNGYTLNLIDTPGHVDFSYEVSRALAAVEGAILLVDGTQGIQAQTLANLEMAKKEGLEIIGAINKIDLGIHNLTILKQELAKLLGSTEEQIFEISGKTGKNIEKLLDAVIKKVPPPEGDAKAPFRALIFDSIYDSFQGAIAYVRAIDGSIERHQAIRTMASKFHTKIFEVGTFKPERAPLEKLAAGEIGYIITGIKDPDAVRVGDTIVAATLEKVKALPGYAEPKPMVFAGFYPKDAMELATLKDALQKLRLNDSAVQYEPDRQEALGQGFRIGCLGILHLEIIKERLIREYKIEPLITMPSVWYKATTVKDKEIDVFTPGDLPSPELLRDIAEPWVELEILVPQDYIQGIVKLLTDNRGVAKNFETITAERIKINAELPYAELIADFYDKLKSVSRGFASLSYKLLDWRPGSLVKLDILVAGELRDVFSRILPEQDTERIGRKTIEKLKEVLPREVFPVAIQAAIGSRILARVTMPALRKDVTAHLYGGDRTRKMKLWKKQKEGKKRLTATGKVNIPPNTFFEILKMGR